MTYREHLIAIGFIRPLVGRPTLFMDRIGKEAAQRHMAEYAAAPWLYNTRPFQCEPPEYLWS